MTQQEMIETVQVSFPDVLEKRIRTMLNDANSRFVLDTRILREEVTKAYVSGTKSYAKSSFTDTNGGELLEIVALDLDDYDDDDLRWYVQNNNNVIIGAINDEGDIEAIDSDNLTIEIDGVFADSGFGATLSTEPAYYKGFHGAPVSKVMERLHAERGNMDAAAYWKQDYQEIMIEAKRYSGSGGIKGGYKTFTRADDGIKVSRQ